MTDLNSDGNPILTWYNQPDPKLIGRTRFFIELASEYGIHFSALAYLVAAHTNRLHRRGRRGRKNCWHQTAEWFGGQIGLSGRQIYRLVRQADSECYLGWERTGRGIRMWVTSQKIWRLLDRAHDEYIVGHYEVALAERLGTNASIILNLLRKGGREEEKGFNLDFKGITARLPWITVRVAEEELRKLFHKGLIKRKLYDSLTAGYRHTRWTYYCDENVYKNNCPKNGNSTTENGNSPQKMATQDQKMATLKSLTEALQRSLPKLTGLSIDSEAKYCRTGPGGPVVNEKPSV